MTYQSHRYVINSYQKFKIVLICVIFGLLNVSNLRFGQLSEQRKYQSALISVDSQVFNDIRKK